MEIALDTDSLLKCIVYIEYYCTRVQLFLCSIRQARCLFLVDWYTRLFFCPGDIKAWNWMTDMCSGKIHVGQTWTIKKKNNKIWVKFDEGRISFADIADATCDQYLYSALYRNDTLVGASVRPELFVNCRRAVWFVSASFEFISHEVIGQTTITFRCEIPYAGS